MFLRVYDDIEKGEELLTEYTLSFWRGFNVDMAKSASLNDYYCHRLEREQEVKKLCGQKRKEFDALDLTQPQRKKRRLSMVEKMNDNQNKNKEMKEMEEERLCSFNYPSSMKVVS